MIFYYPNIIIGRIMYVHCTECVCAYSVLSLCTMSTPCFQGDILPHRCVLAIDMRLNWYSSETSDGFCRIANSTSLPPWLPTDDLSESMSSGAVLVLMAYTRESICSLSESSDLLTTVGSCSLVTSLSPACDISSSTLRGIMGGLWGERVRRSFVWSCAKVVCGEGVGRSFISSWY